MQTMTNVANSGRVRCTLTLALPHAVVLLAALLWTTPGPVAAEPPISLVSDTRYLALGDSLSAGYGAIPTTRGFTYMLYEQGVIGKVSRTIFTAAAVPGAQSQDVLDHQVPQAPLFFKDTGHDYRKVVTLTVGGNDLLALLSQQPPDPAAVAATLVVLGNNLAAILGTLGAQSPDVEIFVANLYDPRLPIPGSDALVLAANQVISQVVGAFPASVRLVDVYTAFASRRGVLLSENPHADPFEVHPSNAGYRLIAKTFADAMTGGGKPRGRHPE